MKLYRPDKILCALRKGPQTYRMIAAAFGMAIIYEARPSWWRRLWSADAQSHDERVQDAALLYAMLADMVAVGQIIHAPGPPETWALLPEKLAAPAVPAA